MFTVDSNSATNGSVLLRKYDVDAPYKLYSSVAAFQTALEPYRIHPSIVGWDTKHPAPALLVKLNGTFGKDAFTVIPPASVTISP